jgi:hypothetical protein
MGVEINVHVYMTVDYSRDFLIFPRVMSARKLFLGRQKEEDVGI